MSEIVKCRWFLPHKELVHLIEFSHGVITGRRILIVDGEQIFRRDRNPNAGDEEFKIGILTLKIKVQKTEARYFEYSLEINGMPFTQFRDMQNRRYDRWETRTRVGEYKVVLDKNELKVLANGDAIRSYRRFEQDHAVTNFCLDDVECKIVSLSSGRERIGVIHQLIVNRTVEPLVIDEADGIFRSKIPSK